MSRVFVLGNGISRQAVDLPHLKNIGKIYGCNALYREFAPDVLVATDRPISQAIQQSGYAKNHDFYTRKVLPDSGAQIIPQPYYGFSSGPVAVALAALQGHREIYLLGFDLGPNQQQQFNNIYAGTEFYKPQNSTQTYTGNWIRQIVQITKTFSKAQFLRVQGATTADIMEFRLIKNFSHLPMEKFLTDIQQPAQNCLCTK
jgi:hypothetical protein